MRIAKINAYLRNPNSRFGASNYSYNTKKQFQIIDRATGKHHYYSNIKNRDRAFIKLIGGK
jgi:hypothetical protein